MLEDELEATLDGVLEASLEATLDGALEATLEGALDEATLEGALDEATLDGVLEATLELLPLTGPYGAGRVLQVLREIQLWFCSQPQPLWVVEHSGYKVPYQLHWPPELLLVVLDAAELTVLLAAEEVLPPVPQTEPVTVGDSALPPFLSTWKPNSTVWPG